MKRTSLAILVCLTTILLVGCNRGEEYDEEKIEDLFDRLSVDTSAVMANRSGNEENDSFDQTEIYDASNREKIVFHLITTSDNVAERRDEMIMVTPDFIYRTRTMKRYTHDYDPYSDRDFAALIERYCTLIDLSDLSLSHLEELALSMSEAERFRAGNSHVLRGIVEKDDTPDGMVDAIEFEYADDRLLELGFRREYDRRSTKQESNLVRATYYYFTPSLFEEFPDLDEFTDA
ncbi:MAG: hypothetical protein ACLFSU_00675 [Acholeplasmataceae bacterium]